MTDKRVLIFTEGGSDIGLGHISRCTSLYDEISSRNIDVQFIINGDFKSIDFLNGRNFKNINWLSEDYLKVCINKTDYCIVDSYLASESMYRIISDNSKKSLFIDDNARINYPKGITVNPCLNADNIDYTFNNECIYLLGAKYIILRRPFINAQRSIINKDVKQVLVTIGGSDIRNLTPKILEGTCRSYPQINFNIVIGNAFHNADLIESIKLNNIQLHYNIDAERMKELMLSSDFAITAAGQTIYELLATKTPFIPIKVIENQSNNIKGLKMINPNQAIIEYDDEVFLEKLNEEFKIMLSQTYRENLVELYKGQIDGFGCSRIVNSLLGE